MWVIGFFGMALKLTEVTLSMLYRNTDRPEAPHGGPMFVADRGFSERGKPRLGRALGLVFVGSLLVSTITGGNMFQAWNVADISHQYFGVPQVAVGVVLAVVVGLVILGGIKRIGAVAGRLVPLMCGLYLVAAVGVIILYIDVVPDVLRRIATDAFSPTKAEGAFLGGTAGYALLWGMKRALFSSEAGQGSSPIAHAAARTDEPAREGVVAGLEPFIDTIVVCTLTALVILCTGIWNRAPDAAFASAPIVIADGERGWTLEATPLNESSSADVRDGASVFVVVEGDGNDRTGSRLERLAGSVVTEAGRSRVEWESVSPSSGLRVVSDGVFLDYRGATLTAKSFDRAADGLGKWLITIAVWLFAISTMISWSYYGEQGVVYAVGARWVPVFKLLYCGLAVVATVPSLIATDVELDRVTSLGTGLMLWANIPLLLLFGAGAMKAYHGYFARLKAGEFGE